MSDGLKQKTAKGLLWSTIERFSTQGVSFVLGILIARQLAPSDYGVIAMLNVFFGLSTVFIDSGFSSALIRKQNRTEEDIATVFYFNILIGFLATALIFLMAPVVADFYNTPALVSLTRVMSLSVFIGSFGAIQQALLAARIDFKTQAKVSLTTTVLSGGLGLWAAIAGWGVWALVLQMMSTALLRSLLLWILVRWHPSRPFSRQSFHELFGFGSKLLVSGILDSAYNNLYTLVIGKVFSAAHLGDYSRANQFAQFPSSNITNIIQRVTFPVLSSIQYDDVRLAENYRKLLRFSAFVVFPLMIGLAALAKPLILVVLTEKWAGAIIFLQILCFVLMWYPVHAINLNLLQVKGRSDLFLKLEVIKKIIGTLILAITIPMGLLAMCYGQVVTSLLCLVVNTYYTGKLIQVGCIRQFLDLVPTLSASLLMGLTVLGMNFLLSSSIMQLGFGVSVGVLVYFLVAFVARFPEIAYAKGLVFKK